MRQVTELEVNLIEVLAQHYPFTSEEIGAKYTLLGSINAVIKLCDYAVEKGALNLDAVYKNINPSWLKVREVTPDRR